MPAFDLAPVDLGVLKGLRRLQAQQLHGPVQTFAEEKITARGALALGLFTPQGLQGYACFSPEEQTTRTLLEIYVEPGGRNHAADFLRQTVAWVPPATWEFSSYDGFALSLAWNARYELKRVGAYLFAFDGVPGTGIAGFQFAPACLDDLECMRPILSEDGFYTTDWAKLPSEVDRGQWYLLTAPGGDRVAVGYYDPIARTPWFADVGMVVTRAWRRRGLGAAILRELARVCLEHEATPVAVCDRANIASMGALVKAGFYCDGRVWSVKL